tara:strand:+ start:338 stop:733 length:396 start_codon:yes stop_codon:yes gene_type:complete
MSDYGPITWILLHTIAAKIKSEVFTERRSEILEFVKEVYLGLHCAGCRSESFDFLSKYRDINNAEEFKRYLFDFHTHVNIKLSKTYFGIEQMVVYEKANLKPIAEKYMEKTSCPSNSNIRLFLTTHDDWFN